VLVLGLGADMSQREFIELISGIAVAWPLAASAQQGRRVRTIGMLMNFLENEPAGQVWVVAFRDALKELGWREGGDLRIEIRWAESDPEWNFWECATGTVP
jgi:putative tryptophan/tyrosine transport system substrate-binding protein